MSRYKTSKWQGIGRKLLLSIVLLLLSGSLLLGERGLLQLARMDRRCKTLVAQNDSLKQNLIELETSIRALEGEDLFELERAARRWGMVRPNEEVFYFRERTDSTMVKP